MTVYAAPGATFEANVSNGASGLVGSIGVRISNLVTDTDFLARTTTGIAEYPALSGLYSRSFTAPAVTGTYSIIWDTGSPPYASEDLVVSTSSPGGATPSGSDLCVVADVKLLTGIPSATTSSDSLIQTLITAASKAINSRFQREFAPVTGTPTRRFRVDGNIVDLAPCDLRSVSGAGIVLDPDGTPTTLTAVTDYKLKPTPSLSGTYYKLHLACSRYLWSQTVSDYGYTEVDITGTWGFAAIPTDVARAAAMTAASWMDAGADQIANMDATVRNDGSVMTSSWAIPAAAFRLLQPYARVIP